MVGWTAVGGLIGIVAVILLCVATFIAYPAPHGGLETIVAPGLIGLHLLWIGPTLLLLRAMLGLAGIGGPWTEALGGCACVFLIALLVAFVLLFIFMYQGDSSCSRRNSRRRRACRPAAHDSYRVKCSEMMDDEKSAL
jgi:hypothetical protein